MKAQSVMKSPGRLAALIIVLCLSGMGCMAQNILYVDIAKKDLEGHIATGESWANAIPELADALKWAHENRTLWDPGNPLRIYVAKGTYLPRYSPRDDAGFADEERDNAFLMVANTQLYGGFDPENGIETPDDARILPGPANPSAAGTILSADINGDDIPDDLATNRGENTYHVLIAAGDVGTAQLDSFTITGGNADGIGLAIIAVNGLDVTRAQGGGMFNTYSDLSITNTLFSGNSVSAGGGGLYNRTSSPTITHSLFSGNSAAQGGGIFNFSSSSPVISNVTFSGNQASEGGGMFSNGGAAAISFSTFSGNNANNMGGGMFNSNSTVTITHTVYSDNSATNYGGGINNSGGAPTIAYTTFSGNSASIGGGITNSSNSSAKINNCPLYLQRLYGHTRPHVLSPENHRPGWQL